MDYLAYCRPGNLITFDDFIDDLSTNHLVFLGEDHFSQVCTQNEETILSHLSAKTQSKLKIMTEDLSDPYYDHKRAILQRFSYNGLCYLPSENREIVQGLEENLSRDMPNIAVLGSAHLKGGFSVDDIFRQKYPDTPSAVVLQEKETDSCSPGIYTLSSPQSTDYLIIGSLKK